jgi:Rod binding domain-containing protein
MLYVNPITAANTTGINIASSPEGKQKLALQELEHFFLFTLVSEMRKTSPTFSGLQEGPESDFYNEMFDDALSGQMAKSGQLGVAKMIEEQINTAPDQIKIQRKLEEHAAKARREIALKAGGLSSDK